ncbi:predicted protein [Naegleria gruberi]|uniref:Predicted protein n=1 Tax=Naegleria gruberi TaxID=5762 RepID=D2VLU1_NAEGR|nr:uncharacterized protein NAEGRDRAFT_50625 [Naegleria gruberi]EFC42201.1 predicted protein [Naegleria gruberi]|eukprot:XP_002674945.1 predicted protein [Naegleria gruberi strain NEG-M]
MKVIPNIYELPTGSSEDASDQSSSSSPPPQSSSSSSEHKKSSSYPALSFVGHSKSAEATYFQIPQLSCNIDMGFIDKKYMSQNPNTFLITHTHADHTFYLAACQPAFVNRSNPNRVYVPKGKVEFVENFLHSCQELNAGKTLPRESVQERKPIDIIGVEPGDLIEKIGGKDNYVAKVVKCDHSVPCNGYAIYERKKKLKKEYSELKGAEIAKLRKEKGDEISDIILEPRIAIMGDTTYRVFEMNPFLLEFPVIVVECTFLENGQEETALGAYHMHWNHIKPYIEKHPQTRFILTHFSLRYTDDFILEFFKNQPYKNITPLVDDKF